MNAGVVDLRARPGTTGEGIAAYGEGGLAPLRERKGIAGPLPPVDRRPRTGLLIGPWETPEVAEAHERGGTYGERVARFAAPLAGPPERRVHEIAIRG